LRETNPKYKQKWEKNELKKFREKTSGSVHSGLDLTTFATLSRASVLSEFPPINKV
jgi:hypothetical protein